VSKEEFLYSEKPALEQLQCNGWSYKNGQELSPETSTIRSSLREVILASNLAQAIQRINPWISNDNLRKIIHDITKIQTPTLIETIRWFWERLTQDLSVGQDLSSGRRGQTVKLIDFKNIQNKVKFK